MTEKELLEDMMNSIESIIIMMKMTGQSKEIWLHNMEQAWDDTPIPDELFLQRGNA